MPAHSENARREFSLLYSVFSPGENSVFYIQSSIRERLRGAHSPVIDDAGRFPRTLRARATLHLPSRRPKSARKNAPLSHNCPPHFERTGSERGLNGDLTGLECRVFPRSAATPAQSVAARRLLSVAVQMTRLSERQECSFHFAESVSSPPCVALDVSRAAADPDDDGRADFETADRTAMAWAARQIAALLETGADHVE